MSNCRLGEFQRSQAMQISWHFDQWPSALHAAGAWWQGLRFVDAALAEAITGPCTDIVAALTELRCDIPHFWEHALAASNLAADELAQQTLVKILPPGELRLANAGRLTAALGRLHAAMVRHAPHLPDELSLRSGPLIEAWNARGPGMLRSMERLMRIAPAPRQARVQCVYPVLGGGGAALPAASLVTIEALLANPHPQLPETVRLSWLLGQLLIAAPSAGSSSERARQQQCVRLGCIPAALAAAEDVEWAQCNEATVCDAIKHWHLFSRKLNFPRWAKHLGRWWESFQAREIDFAEAVKEIPSREII
jgi:hypothetical protein